jgi:bifunctional DNA-binding transcriptional regulator/antitoxin component of YhaV-PrlF toxin-antitoxin module
MTRLSSKNQVTIPVEAVRRAGLRPGMELRVEVDEQGRVVISEPTEVDLIDELSGSLTGVWPADALEKMRLADREHERALGLPMADEE